ncbi:MAG: sulfatase, partial [Gammaproteobacteria bacterium]
FDLDLDPEEMVNLGNDRKANHDLIMTLNAKLETLIKAEIGVDNGRELPNIPLVDWTIEKIS